jgi:hypothetical protein
MIFRKCRKYGGHGRRGDVEIPISADDSHLTIRPSIPGKEGRRTLGGHLGGFGWQWRSTGDGGRFDLASDAPDDLTYPWHPRRVLEPQHVCALELYWVLGYHGNSPDPSVM